MLILFMFMMTVMMMKMMMMMMMMMMRLTMRMMKKMMMLVMFCFETGCSAAASWPFQVAYNVSSVSRYTLHVTRHTSQPLDMSDVTFQFPCAYPSLLPAGSPSLTKSRLRCVIYGSRFAVCEVWGLMLFLLTVWGWAPCVGATFFQCCFRISKLVASQTHPLKTSWPRQRQVDLVVIVMLFVVSLFWKIGVSCSCKFVCLLQRL